MPKLLSNLTLILFLLFCENSLAMRAPLTPSPLIHNLKWGSMEVRSQTFKDSRIWPNHAEEWDWDKTGTRHSPGIQIADLSDFIDQVDVIILSEGVDGVLQIKSETIEYLKSNNKKYFVFRTPLAVKKYNELALAGEKVGALIHTTC